MDFIIDQVVFELLKVAFSFPIDKFPKNIFFKKLAYLYYILLNGSYEGICVEVEQKQQHWISYFQIAPKY